MSELLFRPALELAGLVRAGELTARELVETALRRIDELDPHVKAFTYVAHEQALAVADKIGPDDPRPLAGVPIAVKDNRPVAGMPLSMGSGLFDGIRPPHDAFLVRRLRQAGCVIVGKTSMPEMGILPTTEPRRFGPTKNPWDPQRTPGGSSGGSGAAVAAGMVPVAHGNDGGGSIRIPAACCGLVGLKAARDRVSVGPNAGQSFLTVDGVLTHTVADTVAFLDVLAGYEPGDAAWAPPPPAPYAELVQAPASGLRIGLALEPALESAEPDPLALQAARDAAELLQTLGHRVEEISPPRARGTLLPDFTRVFGPEGAFVTSLGGRLRGCEATEEDVEPLTWALYQHALETTALDAIASRSRLESFARELVAFLAPYDAVLTPALAHRPVPTGAIHGRGPDPMGHYRRSGAFTPYTAIANVTGLPAIALPLYQGVDGLPLAVQLIGPPAREEVLLRLALQLEQACPWTERRPDLAWATAA